MADPFLGEIRLFSGNYAPDDWAQCNGQLLPISQYQALYALIGTTYGGDGKTNFAVPNLLGSVVVGCGQSPDDPTFNPSLGAIGGSQTVTLDLSQVPAHTHILSGTTNQATSATATPSVGFAAVGSQGLLAYTDVSQGLKPGATPTVLGSSAVSVEGSTGAHNNMMPSMGLNYIIALQGLYPTP